MSIAAYNMDPFSKETIQLGEDLTTLLADERSERWKELITSVDITHNSKKAWATIKRLNSEKNVQTRVAAVTPNQVANQLLQNGKPANKEKGHKKRLKGEMEQAMRDSSDQFEKFTPDELNTAMMLMKTGKAAGLDGITTEMIQHFGPKTMSWVLNLFNNCVRICSIPNGWRKTKVVALLKPGKDPKVPKSYRPISLLCILYKLYERIIMARMSLTAEENLTPDQAGFRPGQSTCGQLLNLTQSIKDGFEEKQITGTVFVDITAAYDTVNHKILLLKQSIDVDGMWNFINATLLPGLGKLQDTVRLDLMMSESPTGGDNFNISKLTEGYMIASPVRLRQIRVRPNPDFFGELFINECVWDNRE
ncbi:RNA-directed DNA polymerase from mobile element jockey-like [Elysia marginata]|uniref:RNA-directed DNA polymerase from mobile element jockey-like n=1 Tax=Elysia marginata TaxID=1093978 RepID=A0AAV4HBZ0_9GAST|nr:RNA-directed DNA polymerase from mobile element jockey-like [Elysia marginata]